MRVDGKVDGKMDGKMDAKMNEALIRWVQSSCDEASSYLSILLEWMTPGDC